MTSYTIIAGSRTITEYNTLLSAISGCPFDIEHVVSGGADGVDNLGEEWANKNDKQVTRYPVKDYTGSERPAPLLRNRRMAEESDKLLAIWDGESSGTQHMISVAKQEELEIHIYRTDNTRLGDFYQ